MWRNDVRAVHQDVTSGETGVMRGHVPAAMRRQNARIEESRMRGSKLAVALLLLLAGAVRRQSDIGAYRGLWRRSDDARRGDHSAGGNGGVSVHSCRCRNDQIGSGTGAGRGGGPRCSDLVPLIALAMLFARRLGNAWAAGQANTLRARRAADAAALPRLANAWIDVDGPGRRRLRIAGELVRIGRDEENDLRLEDPNVHRHHALIQRTADAEFVILDVSGMRGNGLAVNGRRLARASLRDGDLIELGTTRVRFRCEPISHAMTA